GTREVSHEEKFDPLSQVERSRQTQSDQENSADNKNAQPVSVSQNLPNQQVQGSANGNSNASSSSHTGQTVNYELNSVRSDRIQEAGAISRLPVAVVVDGTLDAKGQFQPRPKAELDRITDLVKSAVGFDAKRGDVVTVDTMRFIPPELPAPNDA